MTTWAPYDSEIGVTPADDTDTPTLNLRAPDYSGDANVWGQWLNGNFFAIDYRFRDLYDEDDGPGQLTWALPKAGGQMIGDLEFEREDTTDETTRARCGTPADPAREGHALKSYWRSTPGSAVTVTIDGATGYITATNVYATCDERLKGDISVVSPKMLYTAVMSLVPKVYTRLSNGEREIGLIAQDVQHHLPQCVKKGEDGTLTLSIPELLTAVIGALIYMDRRNASSVVG